MSSQLAKVFHTSSLSAIKSIDVNDSGNANIERQLKRGTTEIVGKLLHELLGPLAERVAIAYEDREVFLNVLTTRHGQLI